MFWAASYSIFWRCGCAEARTSLSVQDAFYFFDVDTQLSSWEPPGDDVAVRPAAWWNFPKALARGRCCVCRTEASDRYCNTCWFDDEADEIAQVSPIV